YALRAPGAVRLPALRGAHRRGLTMRGAAILCLCALAWVVRAAAAPAGADHDIVVHVSKDHTAYEIRLEFTIAAPLEQTWNVLSDYDHMAQIFSNMDSSRIVSREGNRL